MPLRVLGVLPRDKTELHGLGTSQDALDGPSSQLGAVVLHLGGDYGTPRSVKLAPPIGSLAATLSSGVKLVERLDGNVLVLLVLVSVDLGPDDHLDLVGSLLLGLQREVELSVSVGTRSQGLGLLGRVEGVGVLEGLSLGLVDDLACKVLVDVGGFERERSGRVDGVGLVSVGRGVGCVLVDSDKI